MSLKRMLLASIAVIALIAPETASAQHYSYHSQRFDRQRYVRPAPVANHARMPRAGAVNRNAQAARKPPPAATAPPPAAAAKVVPAASVSEGQAAAKVAVDELLAREPALSAAKERPNPALAKAAAAKHKAQERKLAAIRAKDAAAAAKRREIADKNRARVEAKAAALKARHDAQIKAAKDRADAAKGKSNGRTARAAVVAAEPIRRMPTPDAPPPAGPKP